MASTVGNAQIEISPSLNRTAMRRFQATLRGRLQRIERTLRPQITVRLNLNTENFHRQVQQATSTPATKDVNLNLTNVGRYQSQVQSATRMRTQEVRLQLGNTTLYRTRLRQTTLPVTQQANMSLESTGYRSRLSALTRPVRQSIRAVLNNAPGYQAHIQHLTRERQQEIAANLNSRGYRSRLRALTRPITQRINLNFDVNSFRRFTRLAGSLRQRINLLGGAVRQLRPLMVALGAAVVALATDLVSLASQITQTAGVLGGILVSGAFGAAGAFAALRLGFQGVADGSKLLTAEAEVVHNTLQEWTDIADDLAVVFQQRAMPGIENFLESVKARLPEARQFFRDFGDTVRDVSNQLAEFVRSDVFQDQFSTTMEGNSRALDSFGDAGVNAFRGISSIAAGAVDQLKRFANWVERLTGEWADFLEQREQSGQLAEDFERMGDAAAQLGDIVGNVFGTIGNIFEAIGPITSDVGDNMERITREWEEWTGSPEGQRRILEFFRGLQNIPWGTIARGIGAVGAALAGLNLMQGIGQFLAVFGGAGPVGIALGAIAVALATLAGAFVFAYTASEEFRDRVNQVASDVWSVLEPVFNDIGNLIEKYIVPAFREIVDRVFPKFVEGAQKIRRAWEENRDELEPIFRRLGIILKKVVAPALALIVSSFFDMIAVSITLVGWMSRIDQAWMKAHETIVRLSFALREVFVAIWQNIFRTVIQPIIHFFSVAIPAAWRFALAQARFVFTAIRVAVVVTWQFMWDTLRNLWNRFRAFIIAAWVAFRTLAVSTWRFITNAISTVWNAVWTRARAIWNAFRNFIVASWNALRSFASSIWNAIRSTIQNIWNALWSALRTIWNGFRNFIVSSWNRLTSIASSVWSTIRRVVLNLWQSLVNALQRVWNAFANFIRSAWNTFVQVAQTVWQTLRRVITNLWQNTIQLVQQVWQTFRNFIENQWNAFLNFVRTLWNRIRTTITNTWNQLWNRVESIWNTVRNTIESSIQTFRDNAINFFQEAAEGIRDAWEQIQEWTAAPVRFVVDTVWNDGVGSLWNAAGEIFDAMPDFPEASVNFAKGGIYPGYTPGRDVGLAAVSGGEAIMRPEWTKAVGADYVNSMNNAARKHGTAGIERQSRQETPGGFASGGIVPDDIAAQHDKPQQGGFLDDFIPDPSDIVGIGSELLGSVGDIAKEALFDNPVTERLAKTAESTIDDNLPSEGLGQISRYFATGLYDHVLASVASLVAPAASAGGGGDTGVGGSALLQAMTEFVKSAAPGARVSSGHRPGDPGYHGRQRAIDLVFSDGSQNAGAGSTPSGQAAQAAQAIKSNFMGNTLELIWDPLGSAAVHNGSLHRFTGGNAGPGTHADHIHWAFGGSVDQLSSASAGDGGNFGMMSGRDVAGRDASSSDLSSNDSATPGNISMIAPADFGSLENATGRYEHYKNKIDEAKAAARSASSNASLTDADGSVMQIAYQQAQSMGASDKVMEALFAAGFVESGFRSGASVRGVDHDSAGFLQQRPSQGWGTVSQVEDPAYATREFVSRASAIEGQHSSPGSLAQAVQRSAFPGRYAQELGTARSALRDVSGGDFDQGGFLQPGDTKAVNKVGRPEPVLNPSQWRTMMTLAKNSEKEEPININAKLFLDGREIDARIETKQEEHDKRLVSFLRG